MLSTYLKQSCQNWQTIIHYYHSHNLVAAVAVPQLLPFSAAFQNYRNLPKNRLFTATFAIFRSFPELPKLAAKSVIYRNFFFNLTKLSATFLNVPHLLTYLGLILFCILERFVIIGTFCNRKLGRFVILGTFCNRQLGPFVTTLISIHVKLYHSDCTYTN